MTNYLEQLNPKTPFASQPVCEEFSHTLDHMDTLQVNIGLACNLACKHCHLSAGPDRTERMNRETMDACLRLLSAAGFQTLDITGGAPEMNPDLPYFVQQASKQNVHIMVRTNLTILEQEGYEEFPQFYADHGVELVGSLPHYDPRTTDRMRGSGTFEACLSAIGKLNDLGYGIDPSLPLDLVYNPAGAFLPPEQEQLKREYERHLTEACGIHFHNLFALTNNPIGRFGDFLARSGNAAGYMDRLEQAFNPVAVENMMCRNQLSVRWDGVLYDCDFNLALDLPAKVSGTIHDVDPASLFGRPIVLADHCYACTAGAGSSCGGTTA